MKIDFKKIVCFGLFASFGFLSAQEAPMEESKEISMSQPQGRCPTPDQCRDEVLGIRCEGRADDYDYDVYTTGDGEERPSSCRTNCMNERGNKKTNCGEQCKRKGAAKAAQE